MGSPKVEMNALERATSRLMAIQKGEVPFRSFFGFEVRDWRKVVDFLLFVLREEIKDRILSKMEADWDFMNPGKPCPYGRHVSPGGCGEPVPGDNLPGPPRNTPENGPGCLQEQ